LGTACATCGEKRGKYWVMVGILERNSPRVDGEKILKLILKKFIGKQPILKAHV
jgi:hypothetical protein